MRVNIVSSPAEVICGWKEESIPAFQSEIISASPRDN